MVKPFLGLMALLVLLLGGMFAHYLTYDTVAAKENLSIIANITKLSSPSLSVAYYEPRVLFQEELSHPAYPQMQTMNKMDIVYVK